MEGNVTPVVVAAEEIGTVDGMTGSVRTGAVPDDCCAVAEGAEVAVSPSGAAVTVPAALELGAEVVDEIVVEESVDPQAASPQSERPKNTATSCDTDRIEPSSGRGRPA
ncbi:hypothetical protein [Nocardia sp. R7R-8]|uniref:hypothetical protein n=1 Tax=Nocardia sp. R7R-8 TaxID=3459304 RepID=UPI00403DDD76